MKIKRLITAGKYSYLMLINKLKFKSHIVNVNLRVACNLNFVSAVNGLTSKRISSLHCSVLAPGLSVGF